MSLQKDRKMLRKREKPTTKYRRLRQSRHSYAYGAPDRRCLQINQETPPGRSLPGWDVGDVRYRDAQFHKSGFYFPWGETLISLNCPGYFSVNCPHNLIT